MSKENPPFKIICHAHDGRVVASLEMDGCLKVYHDHFSDEDDYDLATLIKALDSWGVRREIVHTSKKGVNARALEQLNDLQEQKPGDPTWFWKI